MFEKYEKVESDLSRPPDAAFLLFAAISSATFCLIVEGKPKGVIYIAINYDTLVIIDLTSRWANQQQKIRCRGRGYIVK